MKKIIKKKKTQRQSNVLLLKHFLSFKKLIPLLKVIVKLVWKEHCRHV